MRAVSELTDAGSAEAIGAAWLERALEPASSFGRRARDGCRPFLPGQERDASAAIERVLAAAARCDGVLAQGLRASLRAIPDPSATLARLATGEVLDDVEIYELARYLDALRAFGERAAEHLPAELLPESFAELHAALAGGRRGGGFYLDDGYAQGLGAARAAAEAADSAYACERERLRAGAAAVIGPAVREGSEFAVARTDLAGAPPRCVRVVREAATYLVLELVNDEAALAALAARERAKAAVAEREEDARAMLSATLRRSAAALAETARLLGESDLLLAAVALAHAQSLVAPELSDLPGLCVQEGRFLPLEEALEQHGRGYAPISLDLRAQVVITGPNMGGKSAALRMAGFVQLCAQWGLPVPARAARLGLVERIEWLGAAEEGERAGLLSAFGGEIVRIAQTLSRQPVSRLLLIDEFARTTSPREGRALVVALLATLRERGEIALLTTHYAGVAERARVAHYAVVGLRRAFAASPERQPSLEEALQLIGAAMDYRLAPAGPQASEGDAIMLARLLGLDERMTARAASELRG